MFNPRKAAYYDKFFSKLCLINSFWGFDDVRMLPPNFVLTGPLSRPNPGALQEKDAELYEWLEEAE